MLPFLSRRPKPCVTLSMILGLTGALLSTLPVASAAGMPLVDFGKLGAESQISVNGPTEVATQLVDDPRGKSLEVRCTPGTNPAPGVIIRPGDVLNWNLSAYSEVEADVTNLSDAPLIINLRVDNHPGGRPPRGNVEKLVLPVGKSGTVRVTFGYTMGEKAYALDPAKISQVVVFTAKPAKGSATFRVTALRATGKPGDKPTHGTTADATAKPDPSPSANKDPATPTPTPAAEPKTLSPTPNATPGPAASPTKPTTASPSPSASPSPKKSDGPSGTQKV